MMVRDPEFARALRAYQYVLADPNASWEAWDIALGHLNDAIRLAKRRRRLPLQRRRVLPWLQHI
jgi:hypothetical protein